MLYALYALPSGALLGTATDPATLVPDPSSAVRGYPEWDAVPSPPWVWVPSVRRWEVPGDQVRPLAFRWRYTLAEQVAVEIAEQTHEDATVRATLRILRTSLEIGDYVDPRDPRTVLGVQYHAGLGLIAPERVAEILGYDPA